MSDFFFDNELPNKVRKFLETYAIQSKHPWNGKPLKLLPWQWDELVKPLYGWRRRLEDGTSVLKYKRAGIWVPKKQGKSTLVSGLCLFHLLRTPGAEVYCIASDIEQAKIVFNEAANMAESSGIGSYSRGKKRLWIRHNRNTIEDTKNKSKFRVLSSEVAGKSGINASFLVMDEIAEWAPAHAREIFDRLYASSAARVDAIHIVISTAQFQKEHIGYEQYRYARQIRDGEKIDDTFLPLIYEVPEHEDWRLESNWWAANPSAGKTVPKQDWIDEYNASTGSATAEARFRTLRCNQWCGFGDCWIDSAKWGACSFDIAEIPEDYFHGKPAFIGVDYARRYDLCSWVVLIEHDGLLYFYPRFAIPEKIAKKKEFLDKVPYRAWEQNKTNKVYFTDGDVVNPKFLKEQLRIDFNNFDVQECRLDFWNIEEVIQDLSQENWPVVEFNTRQPSLMSPPISKFERLIIEGKCRQPNNPCFSWNLSNCKVKNIGATDGVTIDKRGSTARIDGIVAAIVALSAQMATEDYYDAPVIWV